MFDAFLVGGGGWEKWGKSTNIAQMQNPPPSFPKKSVIDEDGGGKRKILHGGGGCDGSHLI